MDSSLSSITSVLNLSNSLKDVLEVLKLNQTLEVERETSEQISAPTPPRSSFRPRVESTESGITSSTNTSPFTTTGAYNSNSLLSSPVTDTNPLVHGVAQQGHSRRTSTGTHPITLSSISDANVTYSPLNTSLGTNTSNITSLPVVDKETGEIALLGLARFLSLLTNLSVSSSTTTSSLSSTSSSNVTLQMSTDDIHVLSQLIEILHASLGYPLIALLSNSNITTEPQHRSRPPPPPPPLPLSSIPVAGSHLLPKKFSVLNLPTLTAPLLRRTSSSLSTTSSYSSSSQYIPHVNADVLDQTARSDIPTESFHTLQEKLSSSRSLSDNVLTSDSRQSSSADLTTIRRSVASMGDSMAPLSFTSTTLGGRRPTSRALAAAELLKRYTAYPSVFDANTREFVESIVAPKKFNAAKEKMKSVAAVVGKLAVATNLFRQASQSNVDTATAVISAYRSAHGLDISTVGAMSGIDTHFLTTRSSSPDVTSTNSSSTLPLHESGNQKDPLSCRSKSIEDDILQTMDKWDFNIFEANRTLLAKLREYENSENSLTISSSEAAAGLQVSDISFEPMQNVISTISPSTTAMGKLSLDLVPSASTELMLQRQSILGKERDFGVGSEMLVSIFCSALERLHLSDIFNIDMNVAASFAAKIARGYNSSLSYHNALHGADVAQAVYYTLSKGQLSKNCSPEVQLSLLIAAASHDVGYPGVNNAFLIASGHPLALTYNDNSPLENMHVATAFLSMRQTGCNILGSLTSEQKLLVRSLVIAGILGTDNAQHFKLMTKLKRRTARALRPPSNPLLTSTTGASESSRASTTANDDDDEEEDEDDDHTMVELFESNNVTSEREIVYQPFDMTKSNDSRLLVTAVLHACDISNPARTQTVATHWSDWITNEFHNQGDLMKACGLVVPAMHDRNSGSASLLNRAQTQAGFITVLVLPLWDIIANTPLFQKVMLCSDVYESLDKNLKDYISTINSEKEKISSNSSAGSIEK
jgi:hypothetical protein